MGASEGQLRAAQCKEICLVFGVNVLFCFPVETGFHYVALAGL